MTPFTEAMRYDYPLTADSLVIDAGGYEGNWAAEIHKRYGCPVMVFEPVARFHHALAERFKDTPKITVSPCGFGGADCSAGKDVEFHVQNDSTGAFAGSPDKEMVRLFAASYIIGGMDRDIDLLKLNIEGMEFDVLENLLDRERVARIKNIQVQFHPIVPDHVARYQKIRERMEATHELTYWAPWCWENWRLK